MPRRVNTVATRIVVWLAVCATAPVASNEVVGQTSPPPTTATEDPAASPTEGANTAQHGAVEASALDTFLLRDSKGNLVPVLDMPFEEFERLLRIKRGLAPQSPPEYTLDSLTIAGTHAAGIVNLEVRAAIRTNQSGPVRVPLALSKAVLTQPAEYQGLGEHYLTTDAEGFVLWLTGKEGETHRVTLKMAVEATTVGAETRAQFALPRATESSLRLTAPLPRVQARLTAGEGILSTKELGDGRSEIAVLGPAGTIALAWQAGAPVTAGRRAVLEASGEIVVKIESESRIISDARLRVRSSAGNIESFQIRLPPGMELVPPEPVGYSIATVNSSEPPGARAARGSRVVEVQFDRPVTGIAEVRLVTEQIAGTTSPLLPARFEVLGAARQRGTIDFSVEGDWNLTWRDHPSVRRLDLPVDPSSAKLAARFEYSRQPCELGLTVASRPSRVSIEPLVVVYVDDRQLRLEATFKARFRGARASGLVIDLAEWRVDRLSPSDMFEIEPMVSDASGPQQFPFRTGAAIPNEFEVKLEAHRLFDPADGEVRFTLPRAVADVVAPATVMIVPADNVEMAPQNSRVLGLAQDSSPSAARLPARQQPPLVYRELGAGESASFAADVRVRTRWTTASAKAIVRLDQQQVRVEQRIDYRIAYERRRTFDLLIPRAVLSGAGPQVLWGDEILTPTPIPESRGVGDASRFQVSTLGDVIGPCQLVVTYALALPKWDRQKPLPLEIPLVVPADEAHQQLGGQQIEFITSEPLTVKPDATASDEFSRPTPTSQDPVQAFAWSRVAPQSRWIVQPSEGSLAPHIVLAKTWVQSWLIGPVRQERAIFRLTTDLEQLRIRLPSGVRTGGIQVAIDTQSAPVALRPPQTVLIPLPASARGRECVVELWYAIDRPLAAVSMTPVLEPPALEGASLAQRCYWQVCLPRDEYVLAPPPAYATEMQWEWGVWPLFARPARNQDQLESWIGASRQDPLSDGMNEYLFSTLGTTPPLPLMVASRRTLLGTGGGIALVVGLALYYVRVLRSPVILLGLTVVVAASSIIWPEAAILTAQAAAIGLAIALAVALGSWFTSGRSTWTMPSSSRSSLVEPRSADPRAEPREPRLERLSGLTTATVPAAGGSAEPAS